MSDSRDGSCVPVPWLLIQVDPERLIQPGHAVGRDLQSLPLLPTDPAQVNEPGQQGTAEDAGKMRASLGGVRVVPHGPPARREIHPEFLQEGRAVGSCRVADPGGARPGGPVNWLQETLLEHGVHYRHAEPARYVVVADPGLPPGPHLLALPERPDWGSGANRSTASMRAATSGPASR